MHSSKLTLSAIRELACPKVSRALAVLLALLLSSPVLVAQPDSGGADSDKQTIDMLLHRVEQLEARVAQLEAARETPVTTAPAHGPAAAAPAQAVSTPEPQPETPSARASGERMDTSSTLMRIR